MGSSSIELRVDDLEARLAFMHVTIEEINSVVVAQADKIDDLTAQLKSALMQLRGAALTKDNEPPPHY